MNDNRRDRVGNMTDTDMLREVLRNQRELRGELDGHRKELADHIKDSNGTNMCLQRQLADIKAGMAKLASVSDVAALGDKVTANKTTVALLLTLVILSTAGIFTWILQHVDKTPLA